MTLTFQDMLGKEGIDPEGVRVMLHSPNDKKFTEMLPGLAKTRRGVLEAYSAMHSTQAERTLLGHAPWVAIFLKTERSATPPAWRMLFLGLYENRGNGIRTHAEIRAEPDVAWISGNFGEYQDFVGTPDDETHRWFDLVQSERLGHLQGRLVIDVRLTPAYVRHGERIAAPISAIHAESVFDAAPPDWRDMMPTAGILRELPPGWAARLREWRGIYLIVDQSDGARYVGSAYGEENLLGRWLAHVAGDAGVTRGLAARDPARFGFSILERVSPDAAPREVIALEQTWMERLDTVRFGLNRPARRETPDGA